MLGHLYWKEKPTEGKVAEELSIDEKKDAIKSKFRERDPFEY